MNASRGGLLLSCGETHAVGHALWVTFPFDPEAAAMQPESLARVVRSAKSDRQPAGWNVALQFEGSAHATSSGNGKRRADRNNGARHDVALPIRVRQQQIPWHEETMTTEVSPNRLKFLTNREYAFGEKLRVSFVARSEAPWNGGDEWEAEVTGIEMEAGKESVLVTVRRKSS